MVRVRDWKPKPQDRVHWVNSLHSLTSQCTVQGACSQGLCSTNGGHTLPPCAADTTTARLRVLVPEPQVTEQSSQPLNPDTSQFSGHGIVLHAPD